MRLSAAWEFMKFSIMDALNADWFLNVIKWVIDLINQFSQWSDAAKVTFLSITSGLFLVGAGMMIIGQGKLGWDSIFGMGGFLRGTNKIHATTLGPKGVLTALRKFAIAGIALKIVFDLADYLNEEKTFKETIDSLGIWIGAAGYIAKAPWILAIGIALVLMPIGKQIADWGKKTVDKAGKLFSEGLLAPPEEVGTGWLKLLTSLPVGVVGFAATGLGSILETMNNLTEGVDTADTSAGGLATTIGTELNPKIVDVTKKIDGEEGSLTTALENIGTEMDSISGEKTTEFVAATDERIGAMDEEILKIDELNRKQAERLERFRTSSLEQDTETSSVSG